MQKYKLSGIIKYVQKIQKSLETEFEKGDKVKVRVNFNDVILTDDEKDKLKIAIDYYENDLMLPENVSATLCTLVLS